MGAAAIATPPAEAAREETVGLLRLATAGSVDDGKSTLIGRLLHDARDVADDQLAHVRETSERRGDGYVNLALLTDGLRAEREQGITIDVAYRYFRTARRRFIIADTPGHEQYTRNMVTGASTADLALVLLDARRGLVAQARRHATIASLLGIPHLVVCVNKMDLVGWDAGAFGEIARDFGDWASPLGFAAIDFVPVSALEGDNVVTPSPRMPWHDGPPLLELLESVDLAAPHNVAEARFPVQWVVRPQARGHHDYRGYAGRVAGGVLHPGDEVVALPGGRASRIASIDSFDGRLDKAFAPMSVTLRLTDEIDVSRGSVLADPNRAPEVTSELEADLCWLSEAPLRPGGRYAIRHATTAARAMVEDVRHRRDPRTLEHDEAAVTLELNDVGRVRLRTSAPLVVDPYSRNRATGSFILVDEVTNDTVAGGMVAG